MEAEKREREDNGELEGKRVKKKAEDCNGGKKTVTDTEVDEFFAILRRIHVAVKYFEKGTNDKSSRELTAMKKGSWNPSFVLEDFVDDNGVKDDGKREIFEEGTPGLDLNLGLTFKGDNF